MRNVAVVELRKRGVRPGSDMHPVGNRMNAVAGKHVLRRFGVAARDAVDIAGEVQGQVRQIEMGFAGKAPERPELDEPGQQPLEQIVGKTVVPGLYRRVRREDAALAHLGDIVGRFALDPLLGRDAPVIEQLEGQQRGMAFVQVIGLNIESQRAQDAHAADPEDDLLLQPIGIVPAVEHVGQAAVLGAVLREVGVEQQDRRLRPVRAAVDVEPRPDPHRIAFDLDRDHRAERHAPPLRIPGVRALHLPARIVELLAEIPGPAQ
jgi:hypothetical protein